MARSPSARAEAAADTLLAWLDRRAVSSHRLLDPASQKAGESVPAPANRGDDEVPGLPLDGSVRQHAVADPVVAGSTGGAGAGAAETLLDRAPLVPLHTDWLFHRLVVTGSAAAVAAFRAAAAGAGTVPWHLELDALEEDWLHSLAAPPAPHQRTLSLDGARLLAGELRDAVARRHALAVARVGHSRVCPFDLHALCPVPQAVLRLGPDHPGALAWLWTHWGTTQALRHVAVEDAAPRRPPPPGDAAWRLTFWSADWTPWRALAGAAARWPMLQFDLQPVYDGP